MPEYRNIKPRFLKGKPPRAPRQNGRQRVSPVVPPLALLVTGEDKEEDEEEDAWRLDEDIVDEVRLSAEGSLLPPLPPQLRSPERIKLPPILGAQEGADRRPAVPRRPAGMPTPGQCRRNATTLCRRSPTSELPSSQCTGRSRRVCRLPPIS